MSKNEGLFQCVDLKNMEKPHEQVRKLDFNCLGIQCQKHHHQPIALSESVLTTDYYMVYISPKFLFPKQENFGVLKML